ncbi:MAG: hypothetical protein ABSA44_08195 [Bacteroidota bacterium]|jgi:hypothetical protein
MKKAIYGKLVICTIFYASTLLAQDSLSVIGKFIDGHSWTMDFGISSNLTLRTFQGTAISLSKFISDYQKYRIGISTNLNYYSGDQSGNNYAADTLTGVSSGNNDNSMYSVQITIQYISYATPKSQTSIYFGIGPLAGISWSKQNTNAVSSDPSSYQNQYGSTNSNSNYFVGVLGSCGGRMVFLRTYFNPCRIWFVCSI